MHEPTLALGFSTSKAVRRPGGQRNRTSQLIDVFFCDPHAPWQRGSNENTNGLLRQYFPKGTDFGAISKAELDAVDDELNDRPRKRLGTPLRPRAYTNVGSVADTAPSSQSRRSTMLVRPILNSPGCPRAKYVTPGQPYAAATSGT